MWGAPWPSFLGIVIMTITESRMMKSVFCHKSSSSRDSLDKKFIMHFAHRSVTHENSDHSVTHENSLGCRWGARGTCYICEFAVEAVWCCSIQAAMALHPRPPSPSPKNAEQYLSRAYLNVSDCVTHIWPILWYIRYVMTFHVTFLSVTHHVCTYVCTYIRTLWE